MKITKQTKAWQEYEAGKDYKRKIGFYENVRRNERYYRGDQWQGSEGVRLPKPVFNIIRRIVDYLVCTVASGNISINYTDENMPHILSGEVKDEVRGALAAMNKSVNYRWKSTHMDRQIYKLLLNAALSGDGVVYCYWDSEKGSRDNIYKGDIVTEAIDNSRLFVADVNRADLQSQDYIIISGRASVSSLREEARRSGMSETDIARIVADEVISSEVGDVEQYELSGEGKATYLIKFWREGGEVLFEKSVKEGVVRKGCTGCKLYPVAYFNWASTKGSFHGTSPISNLVPNQDFINRAYAMVMKHMTDTAFSKVVYDKTKIPEWTNEVGEAIGVIGGGHVEDAVSVLGVGKLEEGYLELISKALSETKELMGATDSALGVSEASNTSAILVLQEASRIPLIQVRASLYRFVEDLADIWADMMCAYYPSDRAIPCGEDDDSLKICFDAIRNCLLRANVDVIDCSVYSSAGMQSILDKLLDRGYINLTEYLERIPEGLIARKSELIESVKQRENRGGEVSI